MRPQRDHDLMSVAELARLFNVSCNYVVRKLLRKHVLRPVVAVGGRRYVLRSKAEAYCRKRRRITRKALRELAQDAALYCDSQNPDKNDLHGENVDPPVLTRVSVFFGDCSNDRLQRVCEGTATLYGETIWQRVAHALGHPSPRGPYPVSGAFSVFVHDTSLADSSVLSTLRIDVVCKDGLAYASVQSMQPRFDLEPVPVVLGDDVVTIARKVVASAE